MLEAILFQRIKKIQLTKAMAVRNRNVPLFRIKINASFQNFFCQEHMVYIYRDLCYFLHGSCLYQSREAGKGWEAEAGKLEGTHGQTHTHTKTQVTIRETKTQAQVFPIYITIYSAPPPHTNTQHHGVPAHGRSHFILEAREPQ